MYGKVSFADNQTSQSKSDILRKEKPRPRSRSVYTSKSYVSESSGSFRDLKQYEGNQWIPRVIPNKNLHVEDFTVRVRPGVSF